jgi:hypothetical protein
MVKEHGEVEGLAPSIDRGEESEWDSEEADDQTLWNDILLDWHDRMVKPDELDEHALEHRQAGKYGRRLSLCLPCDSGFLGNYIPTICSSRCSKTQIICSVH